MLHFLMRNVVFAAQTQLTICVHQPIPAKNVALISFRNQLMNLFRAGTFP